MSGAHIFSENAPITKTDQNGDTLKWCLANAGALANGDVVIYDNAFTTNARVAVKTSTTADDFLVAGVATDTVASGAYGWVQVAGVRTGVKIDGTTTAIVIGDRLATGTVAGKANKMKTTTVVGGCLGISLSTVTTGSDSTYTVLIDPR